MLLNLYMKSPFNITSLQQLINVAEDKEKLKNDDVRNLKNIVGPLKELKEMIGMDMVKQQIVDQVLYYAQKLDDLNMMHTAIYGVPGTGKTTLAKIIGNIYLKLGILKTDKFIIAKRSDLIAEYVGQTAIKTQHVIDSAIGGILFIDEVYSLSTGDKGKPGFSKECIDTINQNLSENGDKFVCIIAGYEDDIKTCFFALNKGLERRFPWVYNLGEYDASQLSLIFRKMINDSNWYIDDTNSNFQKNFEKLIELAEEKVGKKRKRDEEKKKLEEKYMKRRKDNKNKMDELVFFKPTKRSKHTHLKITFKNDFEDEDKIIEEEPEKTEDEIILEKKDEIEHFFMNRKKNNFVLGKWFEKNKDCFPFFGGSLLTFLSKVKICHSRRVFGLPKYYKRFITKEDMNNALKVFKECSSKLKDPFHTPPINMYA